MATQTEVRLDDGRVLRVHDTGAPTAPQAPVLLWHHGSPQTGALLDPLVEAAGARGIRLWSYGRPSYGGSTPNPGRTVASAASDVARAADALGIDRFAVMGASGGGPPALACAALLPDRVWGAVSIAGPAPYTDAFDWFAGMHEEGSLRASLEGREARARYAETDEFDEATFTAADWEALGSTWRSLGADAQRAGEAGPDGLVDDDVSLVEPWGFEPSSIRAPVLLIHGGEDRVVPPSHAAALLRSIGTAERWFRPRDGHVSVLSATPVAMDWLLALDR
jgi:pimeloyl-ACP methyl ester carboxylesterase